MFQNAAYILIGLGVLALLGWGVKDFFMASDIHVLIRIAYRRHRGGDTNPHRHRYQGQGSQGQDREFQGGREMIIATSGQIDGKKIKKTTRTGQGQHHPRQASGQGHYGRAEGYSEVVR